MKKIIGLFLAVLLVMTHTAFGAVAVSGDDKDGTQPTLVGDVNGDGAVDNLDAAYILKYDAGIVSSFPNRLIRSEAPEGVKMRLTEAYFNFTKDDFDGRYTMEYFGVQEYFGNYSGCDVAYMTGPFAYTEAMRYVEVAGYIICYRDGQEVYVNKGDGFYTIKEAYDLGYITQEDVFGIGVKLGIADEQGNIIYKESIGDITGDGVVDNLDAAYILKLDACL